MHVGLFWEVLQKGLCAPQGETGFVENVGNFFWLVDFFFFFEGMGLCQIFAVAKLLQADGVWSTLFVVHGLLITVASLLSKHRFSSGHTWA